MDREIQGSIIGLIVIAMILVFSFTRQTVVGRWSLNSITITYNSKNGEEGNDDIDYKSITSLPVTEYSLNMMPNNTFDEMWVSDLGETSRVAGKWTIDDNEINIVQTMKNGLEDDEVYDVQIELAPTGNMITWSRVADLDNDGVADDLFKYVTYRSK
ncbi:MAG: hypothetical protein ACE5EE_05120 [Fidelibacterota bacterium]